MPSAGSSSANAPRLTRELALNPASLGWLTGAHLLAFGMMQIRAGMLRDRFGPRRVEQALLSIAALWTARTQALLQSSGFDSPVAGSDCAYASARSPVMVSTTGRLWREVARLVETELCFS